MSQRGSATHAVTLVTRKLVFGIVVVAVLAWALSWPLPPHRVLRTIVCHSLYSMRVPLCGHTAAWNNHSHVPGADATLDDVARFGLHEKLSQVWKHNFASQLDSRSQVAVWWKGKPVFEGWGSPFAADHAFDMQSLIVGYSTTKVISSLVVALLEDRGLLRYDDRIADHWPEFAGNGKENVTVADLMQHRADDGHDHTDDRVYLFDIHDRLNDTEQSQQMRDVIARSRRVPLEPGFVAYQALTRGLIIRELVSRLDPQHRRIGDFIRDEIAAPLGVEYWVGLPESCRSRATKHAPDSVAWALWTIFKASMRSLFSKWIPIVPPHATSPHNLQAMVDEMTRLSFTEWPIIKSGRVLASVGVNEIVRKHNHPVVQASESPSSNGMSSAASAVRIAAALANKGRLGSVELMSEGGWKRAVQYQEDLHYCIVSHTYNRFAQAGWGYFGEEYAHLHGFYGWHGFGGSLLLFDPKRNLAFSFLTTRVAMMEAPWDDDRTRPLIEAINAAIPREA